MDEILQTLTPQQKEILQNLRSPLKEVVPESVELIKQGKIVYKLGGKDFVWISHYKDHVDLEFAMGASLASNLLRSRGIAESNDNIRHIPVKDFSRLKPELTRLLNESATMGSEHCVTR